MLGNMKSILLNIRISETATERPKFLLGTAERVLKSTVFFSISENKAILQLAGTFLHPQLCFHQHQA